jgi:hypothetical protein
MLQQERHVEKVDVRSQFIQLRTMHKRLTPMGKPFSEGDFYSIILGSLPSSYDSYISTISATSSVVGKTLSPNALMHTVTDAFDHHILSSVGAKEENDVFHSNDLRRGRKGGSISRKNVECSNCGS